MRSFSYSYQDTQGLRHEGEIQAVSKDDAFAALRANGIRPMRVTERIVPVVRKGIKGLRKRDITLLSLVAAIIAGIAVWVSMERTERVIAKQDGLALPRQIIQMPSETELAAVFPNAAHRKLAKYAVPGSKTGDIGEIDIAAACEPVVISQDDPLEIVTLKRIVIGLQQEAKRFIGSEEAAARFKAFLDERQDMERLRFSDTLKRVGNKELSIAEANKILQGMGLQKN